MIVYNVTCSLEAEISKDWLKWMCEVHIPEVMSTGCFTDFKILKVLSNVTGDTGVNFAIQYHANTLEDYEKYKNEYAPILQEKTKAKYGERVLAFRTLLEEVNG